MTNRSSAPRMLAAAMMLLIGLGSAAGRLHAQEATASPGVGQSALPPVAPEPAATASETAAVPAPAIEAGPRIVPPLERYQPSLPQRDRAETAPMASGGSHTVVLSTLALILIVVIVVLLAVD